VRASSRERQAAALLIALVTVVQWLALSPGHDWGDDFAMYVSHARNLVEGRPYDDTGYIFNPRYPHVGPRNYPPVTPLLLTLPYRVFGPDLDAMKHFLVLVFTGFMGFFYAVTRPRMGPGPVLPLALLLVVGLCPTFMDVERSVVSEVPFLFFVFLALWLFARLDEEPPARREVRYALAAGFGLSLYLCYGTRTVGMAMVPALVLHDLWRYRRLRATSCIAIAVMIPCALLEGWWLHSLQDYGVSVGKDMPSGRVMGTLRNLANAAARFPVILSWGWRGELPLWLEAPFALLLYGLACFGFLREARRGPGLPECFVLAYMGLLAALPFGGDLRRMVPVLPLFFFYVFQGVRATPWLSAPARQRWLAAGVVLGLAVSFAGLATHRNWGPPTEGVDTAGARELFGFVREKAAGDGACVFVKARALALYAGCPSAVYTLTEDLDELDRFFASIDARWFIVMRSMGPDDPLARWVAARRGELEPAFENAEFEVYRRRVPASS
jgi:hypothetical protein